MKANIVATLFSIGGQVISYVIRNQPIKIASAAPETLPPAPVTPAAQVPVKKPEEVPAAGIKAGCVPCSLGHLGTCSGMLNEAVRFAQAEGINADIPIDRINTCLDELNALERKDLTPQQIDTLSGWERDLALESLKTSRELRHGLEGIRSVDDLIHVAAETSKRRSEIGREWYKKKVGAGG